MTVAIFTHPPECSAQSVNGIIAALPGISFKIFSKHPTEPSFYNDVDMIIIPGGIGDASRYYRLLKYHQENIRDFIRDGGYYLGICMGAYWAGKHFLNITPINPVQYIKRPGGDTRRPHAKVIPINWLGTHTDMFFYDGCSLLNTQEHTQIVARYFNGDAMAVIDKRVGLIGCHPEAQPFWYHYYYYLRNKRFIDQHTRLKNFYDMLRNS